MEPNLGPTSHVFIQFLTFYFIIGLGKFGYKLRMLSSFVTGKYTSIWEKLSASETVNWDVQYHKSETDCTKLLEVWKLQNKVKIGCVLFSIQGQPLGFDTKYLALADRNMQVRFSLKVVWES